MKMPLLYTLLATAALAVPALAQDRHPHAGGAPAAGAPEAAPASGAHAAGGGTAGEIHKLPVILRRGGSVVFQPDNKEKTKMKMKYKFKGYTKSKASLNKYKHSAEIRRLDRSAVESLDTAKQEKAKELAAQAELNDDVQDTITERLAAAEAKSKESEEAQQLGAAKEAAEAAGKDIEQQMKTFEDQAGKKVFQKLGHISGPEGGAEGDAEGGRR
jgi:hypothetical protein